MGPRDHRIHLGRKDSPKSSPQIPSSTKSCFSGCIFWFKKVPRPKCWPDLSKISPEADFGNFSKSLQKERTANPSEILSRIHPSKLQTEPRGEKHVCRVFSCKKQILVLETQHLRIIFWILDPPGMFGVRNPTVTNYFWDFVSKTFQVLSLSASRVPDRGRGMREKGKGAWVECYPSCPNEFYGP